MKPTIAAARLQDRVVLFTFRPGRVPHEFAVNLPGPRPIAICLRSWDDENRQPGIVRLFGKSWNLFRAGVYIGWVGYLWGLRPAA
ncbi:MAG TPA: hypothetical protein VF783_17000 [Terriglobales bacterium]